MVIVSVPHRWTLSTRPPKLHFSRSARFGCAVTRIHSAFQALPQSRALPVGHCLQNRPPIPFWRFTGNGVFDNRSVCHNRQTATANSRQRHSCTRATACAPARGCWPKRPPQAGAWPSPQKWGRISAPTTVHFFWARNSRMVCKIPSKYCAPITPSKISKDVRLRVYSVNRAWSGRTNPYEAFRSLPNAAR